MFLVFVFTQSIHWNLISLELTFFFFSLFYAVEWNPFLMKTTFTSDLSWFESTFGSYSSVSILFIGFVFVLRHVQTQDIQILVLCHRIRFCFCFLKNDVMTPVRL